MTTAAPSGRRSTGALLYLIASQLIALVSLLPWMAAMTIMGAEDDPSLSVSLFSLAVIAYPLVPLGCAAMAWLRWRRGRTLSALLWATAPLVIALPVLLFFVGDPGLEVAGVPVMAALMLGTKAGRAG